MENDKSDQITGRAFRSIIIECYTILNEIIEPLGWEDAQDSLTGQLEGRNEWAKEVIECVIGIAKNTAKLATLFNIQKKSDILNRYK